MNNEGALIAFTLLSQMIIGSTLVYTLIYFLDAAEVAGLPSGFNLKTPEFILLAGLLIAVLISFLHLGKPSNATNALNNLKSSWISREILSLTLFSVGLALLFIGRWFGAGKSLLSVLFLLSSASGLLLLLSMARLYMIPAVSSWNNWLTPANYTLTALLAGIALMILLSFLFQNEIFRLKPLLFALMILLLLDIAFSGIFFSLLKDISGGYANHFLSVGLYKPFTIIRISASGLALLFLIFIVSQYKMEFRNTLLILTVILVFIELYIGRYMFFASFLKEGI